MSRVCMTIVTHATLQCNHIPSTIQFFPCSAISEFLLNTTLVDMNYILYLLRDYIIIIRYLLVRQDRISTKEYETAE